MRGLFSIVIFARFERTAFPASGLTISKISSSLRHRRIMVHHCLTINNRIEQQPIALSWFGNDASLTRKPRVRSSDAPTPCLSDWSPRLPGHAPSSDNQHISTRFARGRMNKSHIVALSVVFGLCGLLIMALVTRLFMQKHAKHHAIDESSITDGSNEHQHQHQFARIAKTTAD
jgi:hypothetical protein